MLEANTHGDVAPERRVAGWVANSSKHDVLQAAVATREGKRVPDAFGGLSNTTGISSVER